MWRNLSVDSVKKVFSAGVYRLWYMPLFRRSQRNRITSLNTLYSRAFRPRNWNLSKNGSIRSLITYLFPMDSRASSPHFAPLARLYSLLYTLTVLGSPNVFSMKCRSSIPSARCPTHTVALPCLLIMKLPSPSKNPATQAPSSGGTSSIFHSGRIGLHSLFLASPPLRRSIVSGWILLKRFISDQWGLCPSSRSSLDNSVSISSSVQTGLLRWVVSRLAHAKAFFQLPNILRMVMVLISPNRSYSVVRGARFSKSATRLRSSRISCSDILLGIVWYSSALFYYMQSIPQK